MRPAIDLQDLQFYYRQTSWYKVNLRQCNCWSLRCSSSIAFRRCSNYIFMLDFSPGYNGLGKVNCKTRQETFKFRDLVQLILEIWLQSFRTHCSPLRISQLQCQRPYWCHLKYAIVPLISKHDDGDGTIQRNTKTQIPFIHFITFLLQEYVWNTIEIYITERAPLAQHECLYLPRHEKQTMFHASQFVLTTLYQRVSTRKT